jgi:hypothetical protein
MYWGRFLFSCLIVASPLSKKRKHVDRVKPYGSPAVGFQVPALASVAAILAEEEAVQFW